MALDGLKEILSASQGVIATYCAGDLSLIPDQVERMYHIFARGHVPLNDTKDYTERILRWLGGANQGAFIGAVSGDYGHGKTSFQIHVWDECRKRGIFAVPPFSWSRVSDILNGIAAWAQHELKDGYGATADRARKIHETYREKSLREVAAQVASQSRRNVDDVYGTLLEAISAGTEVDTQVAPERLLDYCAEVTECLKEAGYAGMLVLLDEPEVAARDLGFAKVSQLLFDIANGLIQRKGDFGVFVSIPDKFLAQVQAQFPSLSARLAYRHCFPRLRDMYGPDFAMALWDRYVGQFDLGDLASHVVTPETLQAIGQVASSERSDLAYGPRTVISAFTRMLHLYGERGLPYSPVDFVNDCLAGDILVAQYASRITEIVNAPECQGMDKDLLKTLAAFPNGMTIDVAKSLGIDAQLANLGALRGLVYKHGLLYGLGALRKSHSTFDDNALHDTLLDIASEYSPNPKILNDALVSFMDLLVPKIFERRQGHQLLGFDMPTRYAKLYGNTYGGLAVGSFRQTEQDYPQRKIAVSVGPIDDNLDDVCARVEGMDPDTDVWVCFRVRWAKDSELPSRRVRVDVGSPANKVPGRVEIILDWADSIVDFPLLEEQVGSQMMNPLGLLFLMGRKAKRALSKEYEAEWSSYQDPLLSRLLAAFLGDPKIQAEASTLVGHSITGDALALVGATCRFILSSRYPDYCTLIRQPQWQQRLNMYISVLSNSDVPMRCKRAKEEWIAQNDLVARVFGISKMNLVGGAFSGFENLILINSSGRDALRVEFRLHPFEMQIMERITTENRYPKAKFEGKECWYLPLKDIASWMLSAGYSDEEISMIALIGKARGSFSAGEVKRKPVLYCMPLDLEQMRAHLVEKLADLEKEIAVFGQLPDHRVSLDTNMARADISKVTDDDQYDGLLSRINREFELMHDRLPNYYIRIEERLADVRNRVAVLGDELVNRREVSVLQSTPKGSSRWASDLNVYITANLASDLKSRRSESRALLASIEKSIEEFTGPKPGRITERAELAVEGFSRIAQHESTFAELATKCSALLGYLRDYEQWMSLLVKSDEVLTSVMALKKEGAHSVAAGRLLRELEETWEKISEFLRKRNIAGLGSYKLFFEMLATVDEERRKYLQGLRSQFESVKKSVNDLLHESGLPLDAHCDDVYNPDDADACYTRLYEKAAKLVGETLVRERQALNAQRIELVYCRDVLNLIPHEPCDGFLGRLTESMDELEAAVGSVGEDWARLAIGSPQSASNPIRCALDKSIAIGRETRQAVRQAESTKVLNVSPAASEMLRLLPDSSGARNLKNVIIEMMAGGGTSEKVLAAALDSLGELFRSGKIMVMVERARQ